MTVNINNIKNSIISIVSKINDVAKLERIYKQLERDEFVAALKPDIKHVITEITEGLTYVEILADQDYQPITYNKFRALADEIEWDHSLEELLSALD